MDNVWWYRVHLMNGKGAREWRNIVELLKFGVNSSHSLKFKANNYGVIYHF